ncbi:MAG: ParB/RepB/Spo0J family partition protein [Sulfobacillus sp.]
MCVRQVEDHYEIFAGQRRYLAIKKLGWASITCQVTTETDETAELKSLLENVHRSTMTTADKCRIYNSLYEKVHRNLTELAMLTSIRPNTLERYIIILAQS